MAFTLLLAIAVPLVLPPRFSFGPPWAAPLAEAVLLVAIVAIDRGRIDRWSAAGRALSLALIAVLVADAAVVASRLVVDLVKGGPETNNPTDLLKTGFWSGSIRSSPLPSSTGCWTEEALNRVSSLRGSSPSSPSPRSSTRGWPARLAP